MALLEIQQRIAAAEVKANRPAGSVKLIAVSKVQPNARVADVLGQGHRLFGENRVQEAAGKWPDFRAEFDGVQVHLIGPLQSNKVNQALELFEAIHTVDREKLAKKLANAVQKRGSSPELFIQVNTGEEPQKAGVLPADVDEFVKTCVETYDLPIAG